jgi:hypothetical protein
LKQIHSERRKGMRLPQKVLFFGSSKPENSLFETSSRVLELE